MKNRMEKYEDLDGQKINNNDAIKECRNKFYSKLCELRERARKTGLEKEFVAHSLRLWLMYSTFPQKGPILPQGNNPGMLGGVFVAL
uniref:Uncharacterized protein n=1 Tax=Magallana gigas TaxID=29159 RepID=K1RMN6_MAGGI